MKRWWRAHYCALQSYQAPPKPGLFQFGVLDKDDPQRVADFFLLRLPSWGYGYDITFDGVMWGQRALFYHSRRGFKIIWLFERGSRDSAITQLHRRPRT